MDLEKSAIGSGGAAASLPSPTSFNVCPRTASRERLIVLALLVVELGQAEHHIGRVLGLVGVAGEELLELGDGVEALLALHDFQIGDGLLVRGAEQVALVLVLLLDEELDLLAVLFSLGLVLFDRYR